MTQKEDITCNYEVGLISLITHFVIYMLEVRTELFTSSQWHAHDKYIAYLWLTVNGLVLNLKIQSTWKGI